MAGSRNSLDPDTKAIEDQWCRKSEILSQKQQQKQQQTNKLINTIVKPTYFPSLSPCGPLSEVPTCKTISPNFGFEF